MTVRGRLMVLGAARTVAVAVAPVRAGGVVAFTGFVSEPVGLIPAPGAEETRDAVGDVGRKGAAAAWNQVAQIPTEHIAEIFANNVDATRNDVTADGAGWRRRQIATSLCVGGCWFGRVHR